MIGSLLRRILSGKLYTCLREGYRRRVWKNSRYHCPCCNMPVQAFWPFITDGNTADWEHYKTENYLTAFNNCVCPFCGSLPRQRMCIQYLLWVGLNRDMRVLLFAPEPSLVRFLVKARMRPFTADLYRRDVDFQVDIEDTHLQAGGFDMIICNHVLQHVNDHRRALRECARLLSDGGLLLFTVAMDKAMPDTLELSDVISKEQRRQVYGEDDYLRLFGRDIQKDITDCGLTPELFSGEMFPQEILPINGPAKYDADILFVCKKS